MYKYKDITQKIIGCAYRAYNNLGFGFLEKVYKKAMIIELKKEGLHIVEESKIEVHYEGGVIGEYYVDLLVEDKVIVELKSTKDLSETYEKQLINYLKATSMEVGLLINFGEKGVEVRRKIYDNKLKRFLQKIIQ
ncbi:GxxExxY protein [candidate division WOR-3 bacterium]|nr:GxxExxY protein [candidate division WOR-3 bacterium]